MGTIVNARLGVLLCLAAALLLEACAPLRSDQREEVITGGSRTQREWMLQSAWAGRPYAALVAAYGPPRRLVNIPGDRPHESVAIYGIRDNASGCIDAFTVFHGSMQTTINPDSVVTHYFCR